MTGSVQEIRYINRDENTHLWLFTNILRELRKELPELFSEEKEKEYRQRSEKAVSRRLHGGIM